MTEQDYLREVRRRCDCYERNIQALMTLRSALCWCDSTGSYDEASIFACGRRMTPPVGEELTPDFVVQFDESEGMVGELKLTASSERDFEDAEPQLVKYGAPLVGWWSEDESIDDHQAVLVVHNTHVGRALDWFQSCNNFGDAILLSACLTANGERFFTFELRSGAFQRPSLNQKFSPNVSVPMERVWMPNEKKFSDDRPDCPEYTMFVLWTSYLPQMQNPQERTVPSSGGETKQVRVVCDEARQFLQEAFSACEADGDTRQPAVPRKAWVKESLEHFVKIGRADVDEQDDDVYWVAYNQAATATNLEDFARQVYRACPPEWARDDSEPPQTAFDMASDT